MVQVKLINFLKVRVSRDLSWIVENLRDTRVKKFLKYAGVLADRTIFVLAKEDVVDLIPVLFSEAYGLGTFLDALIDPNTTKDDFRIIDVKDVSIIDNNMRVHGLTIGGIAPENAFVWDKEMVSEYAMAVNTLKKIKKKQ